MQLTKQTKSLKIAKMLQESWHMDIQLHSTPNVNSSMAIHAANHPFASPSQELRTIQQQFPIGFPPKHWERQKTPPEPELPR